MPVVLVGDIDRGGVIAALVGTRAVIDPADAAMIRGFIINKFRGDPALFEDGYRAIERAGRLARASAWCRGWPTRYGCRARMRWCSNGESVGRLDGCVVACPITPRISNFDDLDPLRLEPDVELVMVPPGQPIPAEAALIVLAGSKATIADLAVLRAEGWDIDIRAHHRRGGRGARVCAAAIRCSASGSPIRRASKGRRESVEGLGLLDVETVLGGDKALRQVEGEALGARFAGYEMHMGETTGAGAARPLVRFDDGRVDGAISRDGLVAGSYVHGLLADPAQQAAWLRRIGGKGGGVDHRASVDAALDAIAATLEGHLDIEAILGLSETAGQD